METQDKVDSASWGLTFVYVLAVLASVSAAGAILAENFIGTDDEADVSKEVIVSQARDPSVPTTAGRNALLSVTHIEGSVHRWDVTIRRVSDCRPASDERRCCQCLIEAKGERMHPEIENATCRALLLEVPGSDGMSWRDLQNGVAREAYLQGFSEIFLAGIFYDVHNEERVSLLRIEAFADNLEFDPFE